MTKIEIITRLLEQKKITAKEAVELLRETPQVQRFLPYIEPDSDLIYADICPCNTKNGGDGICGCIKANEKISPKQYQIFPLTTTTTPVTISYGVI